MRILYIENHGRFANIVTKEFLSEHEIVRTPSVSGARALLAEEQFKLLIVDYDLDDGKGSEIVRAVASEAVRPRIIAASSRDEGNEHMMQCGADAVCCKIDFDEIGSVIDDVFQGDK